MGGQRLVQRLEFTLLLRLVLHHRLAAAAGRIGRLDAHPTVAQQAFAGAASIARIEGRMATQHGAAHGGAKARLPAGGTRGAFVDQRMGDDLGGHEGVGHDAAVQVYRSLSSQMPSACLASSTVKVSLGTKYGRKA